MRIVVRKIVINQNSLVKPAFSISIIIYLEYMCVRACARRRLCIHTYIYMYTYIYVYIDVCTRGNSEET